jgi:hypothetical protein
MSRPSPIRAAGLKVYLNTRKELHGGWGYRTYVGMRKARISRKGRARMFKVTVDAMRRWDNHYDEQKAE